MLQIPNLAGDAPVSPESIATAVEHAQRFFDRSATAEIVSDPESDRTYVVIRVATTGSARDLIERQLQWHEELEKLIGDDEFHFTLIMTPQP
jgi:hypothetical protein